ncbi:MAG: ribokinase [Actinomycetes bacterium]
MGGVVVVGSVSVDLTAYATPLPRPGETVIAEGFAIAAGGKGANQAVAAARAGAPVYLVGAVGDDVFGRLAREELAAAGVHTDTLQVVDQPTGVAHIRVDVATGQNDIAIAPQANAALTPDRAEAALRRLADRVSVLLVQLETPLDTVVRVAQVSAALGIRTVLDPAPATALPTELWPSVSVVTPNETEAERLTGIAVVDETTAIEAGRWFRARGVGTAVVTRGAAGAVVVADEVTRHPSPRVTAVDTTAAGDAFTGTLGAALALGQPWSDAVDRALAAGALAVTVRGATPSLPTREQVDALLGRDRPAGHPAP